MALYSKKNKRSKTPVIVRVAACTKRGQSSHKSKWKRRQRANSGAR
jgi:hypothetical protein